MCAGVARRTAYRELGTRKLGRRALQSGAPGVRTGRAASNSAGGMLSIALWCCWFHRPPIRELLAQRARVSSTGLAVDTLSRSHRPHICVQRQTARRSPYSTAQLAISARVDSRTRHPPASERHCVTASSAASRAGASALAGRSHWSSKSAIAYSAPVMPGTSYLWREFDNPIVRRSRQHQTGLPSRPGPNHPPPTQF
jgi:hypothetical protein